MKKMSNPTVTVIIPVYNSESTLKQVLDHLEGQTYNIAEIFILDNKSTDHSLDIANKYANDSHFKVSVIEHKKDMGLAFSYNDALRRIKTSHVITLQSDCIIRSNEGVKLLINSFKNDSNLVAVCALQTTPRNVWLKYNFWQKCLFSRHVGRIMSGRNGRFCCYRMDALRQVGLFNTLSYRTAGEDGDMFAKLGEIGKISDSTIVVDHLHSTSQKFSIRTYLYKENQLAEGVGACYGNNFKKVKFREYMTPFVRPMLLVSLLIPYINILSLMLVLIFCIYITKEVYVSEIKNPRVIILPFVNFMLLFTYSFFFLKGFITKRQRL